MNTFSGQKQCALTDRSRSATPGRPDLFLPVPVWKNSYHLQLCSTGSESNPHPNYNFLKNSLSGHCIFLLIGYFFLRHMPERHRGIERKILNLVEEHYVFSQFPLKLRVRVSDEDGRGSLVYLLYFLISPKPISPCYLSSRFRDSADSLKAHHLAHTQYSVRMSAIIRVKHQNINFICMSFFRIKQKLHLLAIYFVEKEYNCMQYMHTCNNESKNCRKFCH